MLLTTTSESRTQLATGFRVPLGAPELLVAAESVCSPAGSLRCSIKGSLGYSFKGSSRGSSRGSPEEARAPKAERPLRQEAGPGAQQGHIPICGAHIKIPPHFAATKLGPPQNNSGQHSMKLRGHQFVNVAPSSKCLFVLRHGGHSFPCSLQQRRRPKGSQTLTPNSPPSSPFVSSLAAKPAPKQSRASRHQALGLKRH